jgi:hypothetical protein
MYHRRGRDPETARGAGFVGDVERDRARAAPELARGLLLTVLAIASACAAFAIARLTGGSTQDYDRLVRQRRHWNLHTL